MRNPFKVALATLLLSVLGGAYIADAGPLDSPGAQKAMVCSACHGFGGNPPSKTVPTLAGMDQAYFKQTITAYAEGKRQSPEMEPYAKYVLEFGVDEIAAYFAAQKKTAPAKPKVAPK
ncbi:MAG TPA: c-type cytochrome [Lacipirellulaceae bacterium]|jgi:cytochrome c553|nr:c-type cytochrome [Lacipirellulaceae bacterium]